MADIKGTNVASKIVPYTTSDNYATHDEEYGRGGYRTVNTVAEMNAIPADRRKEGMLVYVKNDKYYRLNSSNTFEDAGIGSSGGGGGSGLDWDSAHNFSQNGYQKFNNGLMIQWGTGGKTGDVKNVYLPTAFYNTNYNVVACSGFELISEILVSAVMVYERTTTKFNVVQRHASNGGGVFTTGYPFYWIAIGRWK